MALYAKDGKIWLNHQIAEHFGTSKQAISHHILNILKECELTQDSVVKNYLTTATDGKQCDAFFYSLKMIIVIGYTDCPPTGKICGLTFGDLESQYKHAYGWITERQYVR